MAVFSTTGSVIQVGKKLEHPIKFFLMPVSKSRLYGGVDSHLLAPASGAMKVASKRR